MGSEPFSEFAYLKFAKKEMGGARFPLCLSGVPHAPLEIYTSPDERIVRAEEPNLAASLPRWRELMAARYGAPTGHAYPALGTSGAVHLALSAIATMSPRGATVAIETPAYGIFATVARSLGLRCVQLPRRAETAYAVDVDTAESALRAGAVALCVTDLHNPTGARLDAATLADLAGLAERHGAWLVVDEVYRDILPEKPATAYRTGSRVVATSSLTKCYGLGGLRAGWVFATPELVERIERVEELTYGVAPAATSWLAVRALEHADALLDRGRGFAASGRPVMDAWIASTPRVSWTPPAAGITGLVRVDGLTDSFAFARRLREELDVQVVPGSFFGAEEHIRVSFGLPVPQLSAALDVLAMGIPPLVA